jgi:3-oxoacyl-[acyl-carrier protein] reductase
VEKTASDGQRVAIITGGTRGIGREIANSLAQRGFATALSYAGNQASADVAVAQINEAGGRAIAIRADVADEQAVSDFSTLLNVTLAG